MLMNPKRRSLVLPAILLLSVFAACSLKPEQRILGKWQLIQQDGNMTIEFRADGSYQAKTDFGVMKGKWEIVDNSRIATWADESQPKRENQFRFESDKLLIVDGGGSVHKHRRVE